MDLFWAPDDLQTLSYFGGHLEPLRVIWGVGCPMALVAAPCRLAAPLAGHGPSVELGPCSTCRQVQGPVHPLPTGFIHGDADIPQLEAAPMALCP